MNFKGFYFITDSKLSKNGIVQDVKDAIAGGATIIQYREKNKDSPEMVKEALELKEVCRGKAIFLINNRADIAMAIKADGIHLGQEDMPCSMAREFMPNMIIGISVHSVDEAKKAQIKGADYLGIGPIFETTTKRDAGPGTGIDLIKKINTEVDLPIVAIGGINIYNAKEVLDAGANTVCAMSAVIGENTNERVMEFTKLIKT